MGFPGRWPRQSATERMTVQLKHKLSGNVPVKSVALLLNLGTSESKFSTVTKDIVDSYAPKLANIFVELTKVEISHYSS